jgi:hypothetical protein
MNAGTIGSWGKIGRVDASGIGSLGRIGGVRVIFVVIDYYTERTFVQVLPSISGEEIVSHDVLVIVDKREYPADIQIIPLYTQVQENETQVSVLQKLSSLFIPQSRTYVEVLNEEEVEITNG